MKKLIITLAFIGVLTLLFFQNQRPQTSIVSASATSIQPNIVFIMVDDLDEGLWTRMYNDGYLPNIKNQIGDQGTIFNNFFATTSLCCPTRATFLTGKYSHNHGVLDNIDAPGAPGSVTALDDTSTLVTWLKTAGYLTVNIGKYLNGYGTDATKPVTDPRNPAYIPPGWDYWRTLISFNMYNYKMSYNGIVKTFGTGAANYQTDVLANIAVNFINGVEAADATPFFMMITPFSPHQETESGAITTGCGKSTWKYTIRPAVRHDKTLSGYSLPSNPSFNESDLTDKPPFVQALPLLTTQEQNCANIQYRKRAEAMRAVDDLVGTVVNALNAKSEIDNTILAFSSDNGYYLGEHRLWGKIVGYEPGLALPFVIRAPGLPQQTIDQISVTNDWAPTLADFALITPPANFVDGRSLKPVMENSSLSPWRKRFLFEYLGAAQHNGTAVPKFYGVRTGLDDSLPQKSYIDWDDLGTEYLEYYDLVTDPDQLTSLHNDPSRLTELQTMSGYLGALSICGSGTCRSVEDN